MRRWASARALDRRTVIWPWASLTSVSRSESSDSSRTRWRSRAALSQSLTAMYSWAALIWFEVLRSLGSNTGSGLAPGGGSGGAKTWAEATADESASTARTTLVRGRSVIGWQPPGETFPSLRAGPPAASDGHRYIMPRRCFGRDKISGEGKFARLWEIRNHGGAARLLVLPPNGRRLSRTGAPTAAMTSSRLHCRRNRWIPCLACFAPAPPR